MGGGAEVPQWIFSGGRTWESFSLQFSLKCGGKYVQLSSVSVPCAIIYGAQFSRSLRCHFCSQIFMANQTCAQPGTCLFSSAPCVAVPREPGKGCSPGMGARAALGASAAGLGAEEPCLGWERGAVVLARCSAATRACKQGLEPEVLRGHRAAAPAPAPASHQPGSCCVLQPAWFLGSLGSCAQRFEVSGAQLLKMRALVGAAWLWGVGAHRGCEAGAPAAAQPGGGFALCSLSDGRVC